MLRNYINQLDNKHGLLALMGDSYNYFIAKWFFSTNHKIIGTLYIYLGFISGVIGTVLSFLIRLELARSGLQFFIGNAKLTVEEQDLLIAPGHNSVSIFKALLSLDAPFHWQMNLQDAASLQMDAITDFHHDLMGYIVFVIGFVFAMLYFTVLLFREFSGYPFYRLFKAYYQNLTHHNLLEIIWTVVPALFISKVTLASFTMVYLMEAMDNPRLNIIITGSQWYWTYEMHPLFDDCTQPFDIKFDSHALADNFSGEFRLLEVDKELVVPYNVAMSLEFTSNDVLHTWDVPSLGIKIDCVPGRTNHVNLTITRPGTFYGHYTDVCDSNHNFMPIKVVAVEDAMWYFWMFCMAEKNRNFYLNLCHLAAIYPDIFFDTPEVSK